MQISTTGDMRAFLGDILVGLRDGTVDTDRANAIAKISQQINQSLSVEVNATIALKKLGEGHPVAGTMLLTQAADVIDHTKLLPVDQDGLIWCDQCDMRVEPKDAAGCKSKHCKAKIIAETSNG